MAKQPNEFASNTHDPNPIRVGYPISVATILFLVIFLIQIFLNDLVMTSDGNVKLWPITYSVIPLLFLFLIVRLLLAPATASALLVSLFLILSTVNYLKISQNGLPLNWNDISTTNNLSIVFKYVSSYAVILVISGITFATILAVLLDRKFQGKANRGIQSLSAIVFLFPFVIAFSSHASVVEPLLGDVVPSTLNKAGIGYRNWDPRGNAEANGLAVHLIQTSRRTVPKEPTDREKLNYEILKAQPPIRFVDDPPKSVIFIVCEACYYDENNFSEEFEGLRKKGFVEARAISPIFGGNTPQAAFELMTGLPANSKHLYGVFYQEYGQVIRDETDSLPKALRDIGYESTAWHNWTRRTWNRDLVEPKLGFESFESIENMIPNDPIWPRDEVMYDYVLGKVDLGVERKFLFLTTFYSHGPYEFKNDSGEKEYLEGLRPTLTDLNKFVDGVLTEDPNSLIVVISDHKPALPRFFEETGVFGKDVSPEVRGDVPLLVYSQDQAALSEFITQANGQPFYCVSVAFNNVFLGATVPSHNYANNQDLCSAGKLKPFDERPADYPSWLYSQMLFPQN